MVGPNKNNSFRMIVRILIFLIRILYQIWMCQNYYDFYYIFHSQFFEDYFQSFNKMQPVQLWVVWTSFRWYYQLLKASLCVPCQLGRQSFSWGIKCMPELLEVNVRLLNNNTNKPKNLNKKKTFIPFDLSSLYVLL